MYIKNIVYIPAIYNSIIIKKKKSILWVLYNEYDKIKFPLTSDRTKWSLDCETNSIIIPTTNVNYKWTVIANKFKLWAFTWEGLFFEKIKFNGKGFKITFKKKKKFLRFMFGHSHMKCMFLQITQIRRLTKYKYILKSKNKLRVKKTARMISHVRSLNIFTKRGLRMTRQIVFKRKGKKSTYV